MKNKYDTMMKQADKPSTAISKRNVSLCLLLPSLLLFFALLVSLQLAFPYTYGLFIVTPFTAGFSGMLLLRFLTSISRPNVFLYALVWLFGASLFMLIFKVEGLTCIVMSAPLLYLSLLAGALFAIFLTHKYKRFSERPQKFLIIGLLPFFAVGAHSATFEPTHHAVTTKITVDASPDDIWKFVISFPEIPQNQKEPWTFALGYPHPKRCDIQGNGIGAMRYCIFDQGTFDERVTIWEPGKRLAFAVDNQPKRIDGILNIQKGEFLLTPLPNGKVEITGTTWYQSLCEPTWYFDWWCEEILHDIHHQVLTHVKQLAESNK